MCGVNVHRPGQNLRDPDWPVKERIMLQDLEQLQKVICAAMPPLVCKFGCDVWMTKNLSCRK